MKTQRALFLPAGDRLRRASAFRNRLLVAMMLVVSGVTAVGLYVSARNLSASVAGQLQQEFGAELAALHHAQAVRHAILVERCRALVRKPRIHAALEDNALDLLYPSAEDELADVMSADGEAGRGDPILQGRFYRFLDRTGAVIPPPAGAPVGALPRAVEARLALPVLNRDQEVGYVDADGAGGLTEVIATPIISTETGEIIAALVLGFKAPASASGPEIQNGIWTGGRLYLAGSQAAAALAGTLAEATGRADEGRRRVEVGGAPRLMFYQRLNPNSLYPPAFEVALYPLDAFAARASQLRYRIIGAGLLLLGVAFFVSHLLARRLAAPVEKLAVESERSARFSADASHQLKTPVTVLRAGLEELLARENLTAAECDAISALIHQTYRLSSLIEDLLLLSRMDSGRLKLNLETVDLAHLLAAEIDDLSTMPEPAALHVEVDVPATLFVRGESRYTAMILHNLLENARKYNRSDGIIRVTATTDGEIVRLGIANTGRPISPAAQAHIFERFHRGGVGENVAGYGLGLNLARELARLHGGDVRLVRSDEQWTEFEVGFRVAQPALVRS